MFDIVASNQRCVFFCFCLFLFHRGVFTYDSLRQIDVVIHVAFACFGTEAQVSVIITEKYEIINNNNDSIKYEICFP